MAHVCLFQLIKYMNGARPNFWLMQKPMQKIFCHKDFHKLVLWLWEQIWGYLGIFHWCRKMLMLTDASVPVLDPGLLNSCVECSQGLLYVSCVN